MENIGKIVLASVSILGIFALLIGSMPTGFYAITPSGYYEHDIPSEFSEEEMKTIAFYGNITLTSGVWTTLTLDRSPDFDDIKIDIKWKHWPGVTYDDTVEMHRYWYRFWGWREMDWLYPLPVEEQTILDNWQDEHNSSVVLMHDSMWNYITRFGYNHTKYSSMGEALDAGSEIYVYMGTGWEYATTATSGWDLMGRLLVFRMPNMGIGNKEANTVVNGIIALPLWILIALAVFGIITMMIEMAPFT